MNIKQAEQPAAQQPTGDGVEVFIEIRGIYDGWSVAKMKDGTLVNRWPGDDRRHKPTQNWISNQIVEGD